MVGWDLDELERRLANAEWAEGPDADASRGERGGARALPLAVLRERDSGVVALRRGGRPYECSFNIATPAMRAHGPGSLALAQVVTLVNGGAVEYKITTRTNGTRLADITDSYRTTIRGPNGSRHATVRSFNVPDKNTPSWLVVSIRNTAYREARIRYHGAVVPVDSIRDLERNEKVDELRRIFNEGMAGQLSEIFAELGELDEVQRRDFVGAISEGDFLVELARVLDGDALDEEMQQRVNRFTDIGASNGALAGAAAGAAGGGAMLGAAWLLFPIPFVGPVLLLSAVVSGASGGAYVGNRVGRAAGSLAHSEVEAARQGKAQAIQAVGLATTAGVAGMTAARLMRALLGSFVESARKIMGELRERLWALIRRLVVQWCAFSLPDREAARTSIVKALNRILSRAGLPGEMANLMFTLLFMFSRHCCRCPER